LIIGSGDHLTNDVDNVRFLTLPRKVGSSLVFLFPVLKSIFDGLPGTVNGELLIG